MRSHEGEGPKTFAVGVRGYNREEVDEYVARLHGWLLDSEARAEDAVQAATASVGERVTQILRASLEAGEQARKDAESESQARLKRTEEQAADIIRAAEQNADGLRRRAETMVREAEEEKARAIKNAEVEAERAIDDARREIATLQLNVDELAARKATVVAEVAKLQRYLAGTPEAPAAPQAPRATVEAPAPTASPSTGAGPAPMTAAPDATPDHNAVQALNTEAVFTNGERPAATA
jgi:cell division septum initiation protein DivIVA